MAYVMGNPASKKALKEAVAAGKTLEVYDHAGIFPVPRDGEVAVEGPHYPQPHRWYARVEVRDGVIVRVIS